MDLPWRWRVRLGAADLAERIRSKKDKICRAADQRVSVYFRPFIGPKPEVTGSNPHFVFFSLDRFC